MKLRQSSDLWRRAALSGAVAAALLAGCAQGNNKPGATAVGVGVGAIIGEKVIGGKMGAAIGAAIGGIVGNRIGEQLDEQDRQRMAALEATALRTNQNGTFTSKQGGKVSIEAGAQTFEDRKPFTFAAGVTPRRVVLSDPKSTNAYVDTPLFSEPTEAQAARMVVRRGVPITVVASVLNLPGWVVVGDSNIGIGYLPVRYLQADIARKQPETPRAPATPSRPTEQPVVVASQAPMPTDAQRGPTNEPATGSKTAKVDPKKTPQVTKNTTKPATPPAKPVVTASKEDYQSEVERTKTAASKPAAGGAGVGVVQASLECKTIKRRYTPPNSQEVMTEDVKYCNEPPKGWQTVTV